MGKNFPVGILKISMGFFFLIISNENFFSTGKIRKNKMRVLSRRSLLKPMDIAEKKLYGSIHKFNFSHDFFFPFCNMGKNPMGFFDFLKLLISAKIMMI